MTENLPFFLIFQALLMFFVLLSGFFSIYFENELMNFLKEKYVKRWAELTGAKFYDGNWVGGRVAGIDGIKYVLNKTDDEKVSILKLKSKVRKCYFFTVLFIGIILFNFFVFSIFCFLHGFPKK